MNKCFGCSMLSTNSITQCCVHQRWFYLRTAGNLTSRFIFAALSEEVHTPSLSRLCVEAKGNDGLCVTAQTWRSDLWQFANQITVIDLLASDVASTLVVLKGILH
jgi:exo-beta-1,3-glucanase (GH17 family)